MKDCLGSPLSLGGTIIGIFELVTSFVGIVFYICHLTLFDNESGQAKFLSNAGLAATKFGAALVLILFIVQFVVSISLMYGIRTKSVGLLQVWMIFKILLILVEVFFCIIVLFFGPYMQLITYVISLVISIICFKVIFELLKEIQLENVQREAKDGFQEVPVECMTFMCASL